jgi:hypothetical protein
LKWLFYAVALFAVGSIVSVLLDELSRGFLFLSAWALVAFLVFYFGVPETRPVPSKT